MERPILFVNACVRKDSRTRELAEALLQRLDAPYEEVRLGAVAFPAVDEEFLALRDGLLSRGALDDPLFDLARQFARAEIIVIAAPYWDLSFPAALGQYLEQINVVGITFRYTREGAPVGLCRARGLYFVTTAGGCYCPEEYGFGYVRALARDFWGIGETRLIKAVGLDLDGADAEGILLDAKADVAGMNLLG